MSWSHADEVEAREEADIGFQNEIFKTLIQTTPAESVLGTYLKPWGHAAASSCAAPNNANNNTLTSSSSSSDKKVADQQANSNNKKAPSFVKNIAMPMIIHELKKASYNIVASSNHDNSEEGDKDRIRKSIADGENLLQFLDFQRSQVLNGINQLREQQATGIILLVCNT